MENKKILYIFLSLIIGISIGYFLGSGGIQEGGLGAKAIEYDLKNIKNEDPVLDPGRQNLNCSGLGSMIFETPPQAGVPGATVGVTVGGVAYNCEWGPVY